MKKTNYEYGVHEYKGYAFVKEHYGGAWHIHKIKDGEIQYFSTFGFARTLAEAKKLVDKLDRKK